MWEVWAGKLNKQKNTERNSDLKHDPSVKNESDIKREN